MKRKNKRKSKSSSKSKQLKKELISKLTTAFNEIVIEFGKAKNTDKVLEKFTKQLVKKVTFSNQNTPATVTEVKAEEELSVAAKEKATKAAVKKPKVPVKS